MIEAVLYSDPACPWAYSESPALRVIEWRYREQLKWRLVLIGLTENASQYEQRGYTPLRGALGQARFRRRYGMPFSAAPIARLPGGGRGPDRPSRQRVAGVSHAAAGELQHGAAARRRPAAGRGAAGGARDRLRAAGGADR